MLQTLTSTLKTVGHWALFTISVIASFCIGYYYTSIQNSIKSEHNTSKFVRPKTSDEISISVTDKGEMLIIDRITGNLTVYEDSVGMNVFKLYGSHIVKSSN
jgi:hypothetical protein